MTYKIHVDSWRICKMWNGTTDCSASLHAAHQGTKLLVSDLSSHTSLQSFPPLMIAWHSEDYDACGDQFTNRCITWNKQKHGHVSFLTLLSNFVSMLCRQGFQLFRETCSFQLGDPRSTMIKWNMIRLLQYLYHQLLSSNRNWSLQNHVYDSGH